MAPRDKAVSPHVAQNTSSRRSTTTPPVIRLCDLAAHPQTRRRSPVGWAKTVAGLRKMRHRGLLKVDWQFTLAMTAYDLVRLPKLLAEAAE